METRYDLTEQTIRLIIGLSFAKGIGFEMSRTIEKSTQPEFEKETTDMILQIISKSKIDE